jgi:hypothetical protein
VPPLYNLFIFYELCCGVGLYTSICALSPRRISVAIPHAVAAQRQETERLSPCIVPRLMRERDEGAVEGLFHHRKEVARDVSN